MSWYRTGTVTVTNGSKNVTGVGTLWTTAVNAGDAFALVDANLNPTGAWYEVETVTSNTAIVLKQSYAGTTGSNKQYCVFNLVGNMTTPSFAQRLATFFASFQSFIDQPTTTPTASSIPVADANGDIDSGWIKDASATVKGVVKVGNSLSSASGVLSVVPASTTVKGAVELATAAEATEGNDTTRAITPSVSGSRLTFATTSTDDATSVTAAPLKSAGGLAVAKGILCGGDIKAQCGRIRGVSLSNVPADTWTEIGLTVPNGAGGLLYVGAPINNEQKSLYAFLKPGAAYSGVVTQLADGGNSYGIQVRIPKTGAIEVYHTYSSATTISVSLLELFMYF